MTRIEIIVDAISHFNAAYSPDTEAYRLRNPLLLRSFARPGKHETDENGRRIFSSFINGYKAALFDVALKASGKSRANVKEDGTLEQLLICYEVITKPAQEKVVNFIRRALRDDTISIHTPATFFLEI